MQKIVNFDENFILNCQIFYKNRYFVSKIRFFFKICKLFLKNLTLFTELEDLPSDLKKITKIKFTLIFIDLGIFKIFLKIALLNSRTKILPEIIFSIIFARFKTFSQDKNN
jgi:hypothetical protein